MILRKLEYTINSNVVNKKRERKPFLRQIIFIKVEFSAVTSPSSGKIERITGDSVWNIQFVLTEDLVSLLHISFVLKVLNKLENFKFRP